MSRIFIDIETIPDMRLGAREAFITAASEGGVKPPSTYTKEQLAADLGIYSQETIKFTAKDSLIAQWMEQVGPTKAEEIGDASWRKTSFDGTQGQLLIIGVAVDDESPVAFHGEEVLILRDFSEFLSEVQRGQNMGLPEFVGHNLIDFDLPFIFHRSAILGIQPHLTFPVAPSRYSDRIYDTMTKWAGFGNRVKLEKLALVLGVGSKGDIDGSQVYDYYAQGRTDELIEYCKNDVTLTREVWRRMNFIKEAA